MHAHRMLQGWFFLSTFWTPDRAKAFLTNVPLVSQLYLICEELEKLIKNSRPKKVVPKKGRISITECMDDLSFYFLMKFVMFEIISNRNSLNIWYHLFLVYFFQNFPKTTHMLL